ncbi:MAG: tRNA-dihydrouridine synthase [Desulfobacterales bacterium]
MKIGSVILDNIMVLAPLAGITNLPFRLLAKASGCGLVCSEMISANGLVYKSAKTQELLRSRIEEKPLSVQIFGSDPYLMAEAAAMVEESGADILDINLGCAVKKVLKTGSGAALMKAPDKVEKILLGVRKTISIPLTVKMRTGWDKSGGEAFKIAKIAEATGVDGITVHPRLATQGFGGKAMKRITNSDGVMIGRAAIGNPWIFSQALSFMKDSERISPNLFERFEVMKKYITTSIECFGEQRACRMMRSHLGWFVKGLRFSTRFRESIKRISTEKEALSLIKEYFEELS